MVRCFLWYIGYRLVQETAGISGVHPPTRTDNDIVHRIPRAHLLFIFCVSGGEGPRHPGSQAKLHFICRCPVSFSLLALFRSTKAAGVVLKIDILNRTQRPVSHP